MNTPSPTAHTTPPAARESAAPALDRGLSVLSFLRTRRGATVAEIAESLRIPPASAYRLLNTLERRRFAVKDARDGRYRLGSQILLLAGSLLAGMDLRALAHPCLQELFDRFKETVELAILESDEVVVIDKIEGEDSVHIINVGGHRPPFYDSTGFCLLSSLPRHLLESAMRRHVEAWQRETLYGPRKMEALLETIRQQGHMADEGPAFERINRRSRRIAVPIQDHMGRIRASLGIVVAVSRWEPERIGRLTRGLTRTGRRINELLGFRGQLDETTPPPTAPLSDR